MDLAQMQEEQRSREAARKNHWMALADLQSCNNELRRDLAGTSAALSVERQKVAVLLVAARYTLAALDNMTTAEFQIGDDKPCRESLADAIEYASR